MKLSELETPAEGTQVASQGVSPPPMTLSLSSLNPADVTQVAGNENEMKYGTLPQQALAGVEGFARGVTLGTSDHIENALARSNPALFGPEARKGRIEENPFTSTLGNMGGGAALIYGTGGMAGPAMTGARAATIGLGAMGPLTEGATSGAQMASIMSEGALFGAGNAISDSAMGDPHLNAQKVLSEIGMGAALGAGLGVLSKGIESVPALLRGSKAAEAVAEGTPVIDVPKTGAPASLEEMERRVSEAKAYGGQPGITELPPKPEAVEAASRVGQNMQFPVTPMQMDSLASQDARNEFKTMLEVPGKNGQILRDYQGAQKKELTNTLDHTIDNIVPGYEPTSDAAVAGERASELFTKQIQGTRDSLGPAFEQIKSTPLNDTDHLPGVMEYLTDPKASPYGNPKLANMFDTGGDELAIHPYKTSMGIDRSTYTAVKQAVESLKDNPKDFETLFDVRKGLSQNVDVTKLGDASKEIAGAKAAMMDYIQEAVQAQDPDLAVRDTFKKWAINEQNAQLIERKFGAEIGSGNFRSLARGKSDEGILKKIFADSETVNAVKNILPVDDFNKLLSDHLSILRNDATDKGVFSSNKFYSQLKRGQYALNEAFQNNAEPLQKIKDSLTLLRIFADDAPINPSGTAKTLIQSLLQGGLDPFAHIKSLGEFAKGKLEEAKMAREINLKLAGQSEQIQKLNAIQGVVQKVNAKIQSGAKSIFNSGALRGAALSGVGLLSDHAYDKIAEKINQYVSNPQTLMDHMADNTTTLHNAAPNITQALQTSMVQGVTFLNDKLPKPPMQQMPLSSEWKPSAAQKTQFNQYYQAVNSPIGTLHQVRNGTISNHAMEALQAVHPHLLHEMRAKVQEHMSLPKAKALTYSQKLGLAKFLGQPLDENMLPAAIQANQMAMQSPNQSQQTSQAQARKGGSTLGGLKQLDFASRTATRTSHRDE